IADDSALADPAFPNLELWLDQGNERGLLVRNPSHRRKEHANCDERRVQHDETHRLGELFQIPGVRPIHDDDARIDAQRPVELAISDVNGVHAPRPMLQQAIREPAGRGPNIRANAVSNVDSEMRNGVRELDAAATYVGRSR